jgi:hypothetical protein
LGIQLCRSLRVISLRGLLPYQRLVTVTVWRLKDPYGVGTRCVLEHVGPDIWELRVQRGEELLKTEQHSTADAALHAANAMWLNYLLDGWLEE